jgi:hypothetical protein
MTLAADEASADSRSQDHSRDLLAEDADMFECEVSEDASATQTVPNGANDLREVLEKKAGHPYSSSVFGKFAESMGYEWCEVHQRYENKDGYRIVRTEAAAPFTWVLYDSTDTAVWSFWDTPQCLEDEGVVVPADLFALIGSKEGKFSLVTVDKERGPLEIKHSELREMIFNKQILVEPVSYCLKPGDSFRLK